MNTKIIKIALTIAAVLTSGSAIAYEDDVNEDICKKPKYHDFSLPEYKEPEKIEVAPQSEFEFKISVWSDPKTLKLTVRKEKLDYTVESTTTFHRVKSKLPASLTGKFARINATVKAELGCDEQGGWLIKVADKNIGENAAASQATTPAPQPVTSQSAPTAPESNTPAPEASSPAPESNAQGPQ